MPENMNQTCPSSESENVLPSQPIMLCINMRFADPHRNRKEWGWHPCLQCDDFTRHLASSGITRLRPVLWAHQGSVNPPHDLVQPTWTLYSSSTIPSTIKVPCHVNVMHMQTSNIEKSHYCKSVENPNKCYQLLHAHSSLPSISLQGTNSQFSTQLPLALRMVYLDFTPQISLLIGLPWLSSREICRSADRPEGGWFSTTAVDRVRLVDAKVSLSYRCCPIQSCLSANAAEKTNLMLSKGPFWKPTSP